MMDYLMYPKHRFSVTLFSRLQDSHAGMDTHIASQAAVRSSLQVEPVIKRFRVGLIGSRFDNVKLKSSLIIYGIYEQGVICYIISQHYHVKLT